MILENTNNIEINEEIKAEEEEAVVTPKKKRKNGKKSSTSTAPVVEEKVAEDEIDFEELIGTWKREHKRLFKNEIDGEILIWRRLKRGEYKEILKADEDELLTKQEMMVKAAVLYPFNVEELIDDNAGLATVLSEEILAKSGFAISYTEEL